MREDSQVVAPMALQRNRGCWRIALFWQAHAYAGMLAPGGRNRAQQAL